MLYYDKVSYGSHFVFAVGECMICINQPDGIYEANCRAYTLCIDGQDQIVNCEEGQAFNRESKQCERWVLQAANDFRHFI